MSFESVRDAYASRVHEYINAVGRIEHASEPDRERIRDWAAGVDGLILDVGSGPGQWTDYLRESGARIEGVEPVPEFVAAARARYPESTYREGRAERLRVADGELGGILAWFSLIHTDPRRLDECLREFARAIAPGGSLLVGFFAGERLEPFEHAVATAYYWPVAQLAERIESAGFTVRSSVRVDPVLSPGQAPGPGARPVASIVAVRARL